MQFDSKKIVQSLITLVIGVLVGIFGADIVSTNQDVHIDRNGLYAVFVDNGQVYFGSIESETQTDLVLTHIFYLQKDAQAMNAQGDAALLKLGNELHGPKDRMEINREHILYLEELKEDGKVSQAIQSYTNR
jgi:hypothetical protein